MGFGNFLKGIFGGGAKGAATGASAGPWGALAGLAGGALAGGAASALSKSPRMKQASTLTPQQQGWQSQLGNQASQALQNPYEGFEPIANQARDQFNTSTIPSLAERFTSMGTGGQRSSAFQGALGQAGAGLETNLAAMRAQYGLQNRELSGRQLSSALNPSFENYQQQKNPGFLETSLSGLSGILGQYGGQQAFDPRFQNQTQNQNQAAGSFGGQNNQNSQALMDQLSQILQLLKRQGIQ